MHAVREETRVFSLPSGDVPALVCAPEGVAAPAAVVFYHGLGVAKETHRKEGHALAAAGLAAVLPDAPHHGARRSPLLDEMDRAAGLAADRILVRLVTEGAAEVPALLDQLLAAGHPRVAVAGISMGAYFALAAGTLEPRLAAVVSILGSPDWTPRDGVVPPDLQAAVARDPMRLRERFPPRPLLLLNGARDQNVRPEPARRFAAALRPLYDAAGASEWLVHREYPDADHFPSERDWNDLWATAVDFLSRALSADAR